MGLTKRERQFAAVGLACLAALAVVRFVMTPLRRGIDAYEGARASRMAALKVLTAQGAECAELSSQLAAVREQIAAQPKDFSLVTFLESVGREIGLGQSVKSVTRTTQPLGDGYEEVTVELKLGGVALSQVMGLLVGLERAEQLIGVKGLQITTAREGGALDAVVTVATVVPSEAG